MAGIFDVGMGLELVDGSLGGILRVTASIPAMRTHVHDGRISFGSDDGNNLYSTNIQVADLNALNVAIIRAKDDLICQLKTAALETDRLRDRVEQLEQL